MPIRTFFHLPGPFVFVGKSRMEKDYERQRTADQVAAMSPWSRALGGLVVAALVWFVLLRAAWLSGPGWGWSATFICAAWTLGVVGSKARRGADAWVE